MPDLERPNIDRILAAYAKIANRVADRVLEDEKVSTLAAYEETPLLHALSAAVQALGSEYARQTHQSQASAGARRVQLQ
jgi:hypothetical protein